MSNREHEALKVRYRALSDDWNRQRDVENQWIALRNRLLMASAIVFGLLALAVITGTI